MPWSVKQHKLFEGIAHGTIKPKGGLTKDIAQKMASEGIKRNLKTVRETLYGKQKDK